MWEPLTSLSEGDYRHLATLPGDGDSTELADTIRLIADREYAAELSAVTSMGNLSLTTARTYGDHHHHWHHTHISLSLNIQRKIRISYNPGGERDHKPTASTIVANPAEAADYIDMLMIRMPHDTADILDRIAEAEERKAAYERTKTESGRGDGIAPVTPPTPPGMRVCLAALALRAACRLAVSLRSAAPGGSNET